MCCDMNVWPKGVLPKLEVATYCLLMNMYKRVLQDFTFFLTIVQGKIRITVCSLYIIILLKNIKSQSVISLWNVDTQIKRDSMHSVTEKDLLWSMVYVCSNAKRHQPHKVVEISQDEVPIKAFSRVDLDKDETNKF